MRNLKSLLKKIIIIVIVIYGFITYINQQKILNTYASNAETLDGQITEAKSRQQELKDIKDNVTSSDYIEEVAREKLDMYLPNERAYVDNSN